MDNDLNWKCRYCKGWVAGGSLAQMLHEENCAYKETPVIDIPDFLRRQEQPENPPPILAHCAYCGWERRYKDRGVANDCIKIHVDECELHPMRALQAEIDNQNEKFPLNPTLKMIDEGAQRLASFEDGSVWPDSWDALEVSKMRTLAERVWRSMWVEANG